MGKGGYMGGSTIIRPGSNWFGRPKNKAADLPASDADLAAGNNMRVAIERQKAVDKAKRRAEIALNQETRATTSDGAPRTAADAARQRRMMEAAKHKQKRREVKEALTKADARKADRLKAERQDIADQRREWKIWVRTRQVEGQSDQPNPRDRSRKDRG